MITCIKHGDLALAFRSRWLVTVANSGATDYGEILEGDDEDFVEFGMDIAVKAGDGDRR